MSNQSKVAVIGCGTWGKNLVRNFYNLGSLAAISEHNLENATQLASQYVVPNLSLEEILERSDIHGVAIAAPSEKHFEIARKALVAGKHVFVEKPLTLDLNHARELATLADTQDNILMVGHLLHYHPAFLHLVEMVKKEKKLGRLRYIYSNRLNLGRIRIEENCLWDLAPHDISMILGMTGEMPISVRTEDAESFHKDVVDTTTVFMTFPTGLKAHIFMSWLHPFKEHKLVVIGDTGMAVFDDAQPWESKLMYYPHRLEWVDGKPHTVKMSPIAEEITPDEPLKLECQHFLDCISNNTKPRTGTQEALRVMEVLEKAQQSINQSKSAISKPSDAKVESIEAHLKRKGRPTRKA